jgi:nucleotidyltransferase substrate binding protein (TIGR01987 family)
MNNKDIRWKQRFENLEKAIRLLRNTAAIDPLSEAERAGLIQFFEVSFELSWKTLKDYLEDEGFIVKSPREAIKIAIQAEILVDGQVWMDALDDRNLTTHIYDELIIAEIVSKIKQEYWPAMEQLYVFLKQRYDE